MPPARCTSSMWKFGWFGATLDRQGTWRLMRSMSVRSNRCPPLRSGEDVQHGVRRAAHRDVERHGVRERGLGRDRAGRDGVVLVLVVALREPDDAPGLEEELLARGVRREGRAVAGERQAERLGEAVHRVRGEHAGARPARGARVLLDLGERGVGHRVVGRVVDRVDEVERGLRDAVGDDRLAGLHGPAGHEDHRDVEPQRGVEHAGRDLVAVRDAHEGVGAVRVDHVLDRVGDEVAARERVEHAAVAHGDAVVDGDGVELLGDAAGLADRGRDEVAHVLEVYVAGDELRVRVGDRDDRLAEVLRAHAGRAPEGAGAGHVAAVGGRPRAQGAAHSGSAPSRGAATDPPAAGSHYASSRVVGRGVRLVVGGLRT